MRPVSAHAAALDRDRCDLTIMPSIISVEPIPAFSSQYLLRGRHKARSCTQITGPSPNNHCIKNQLRTFRLVQPTSAAQPYVRKRFGNQNRPTGRTMSNRPAPPAGGVDLRSISAPLATPIALWRAFPHMDSRRSAVRSWRRFSAHG